MRLIKDEDVCEMLDIIADSKAITTKHGVIAVAKAGLDDIPTIDPESLRPQAEWEMVSLDDQDEGRYRCTACKEEQCFFGDPIKDYNAHYCPNCGARMKGKGE